MLIGPRHGDSTMNQQRSNYEKNGIQFNHKFIMGFIDTWGIFLTRTEAWKIAYAANQILYRCGGDETNGGTLFSDNLY